MSKRSKSKVSGGHWQGGLHEKGQRIAMQWLNFSLFRRLPMIRQNAASECGLACLAMMASYYGHRLDMSELRRRHSASLRGLRASDLKVMAGHLNMSTRVARCDTADLRKIKLPCMLHWGMNHLVVLKKVCRSHIIVHDPALGVLKADRDTVSDSFTGVVVELTPTGEFKKKPATRPLKLSDLLAPRKPVLVAFAVSLAMFMLVRIGLLASPFYLQIFIDEVLAKRDLSLMTVLALFFGAISAMQVAGTALRDISLQFLSQSLSFDMTARILNRLLRLDMKYFNSRNLGDVQQRVQSLDQITVFLTNGAPAALMEIIFLPFVLGIMFYYIPNLAWIIVGCMALLILWKVAIFKVMLRAAAGLIVAETREQTHLLETIRSMMSMKILALQDRREEAWQNHFSTRINAHIRVGNLSIIDNAVQGVLTSFLYIYGIYMAGGQVLSGAISIGIITAFMAYRIQFQNSAILLMQTAVDYKLLQVPLGRVSDIVFGAADPEGEDGGRASTFHGGLRLHNIHYSHGSGDVAVLRGASLSMKPGDRAVVCGASGQGKSTLLQVATGILRSHAEGVLYDGRAISKWSRKSLLRQVGAVLQGESLLKGTLADNIGGMGDSLDMERVRHVAKLACIDGEIEQFPMGYETLVGDMGSSLSAGQDQRILIARALYPNPKMLILDEATSALDLDTENQVYTNLFNLKVTILATAHRPETIRRFPHIYDLKNGKLFLRRRPHDSAAENAGPGGSNGGTKAPGRGVES